MMIMTMPVIVVTGNCDDYDDGATFLNQVRTINHKHPHQFYSNSKSTRKLVYGTKSIRIFNSTRVKKNRSSPKCRQ